MAIQQIPGYSSGFLTSRYSSMNKRALGKLTDSNHLSMIHLTNPADYDKKIISLFTQSSLFASDFLQMVNKAKPFFIKANTDAFRWKVRVPYQYPVITQVPDSTLAQTQIGIDGQEFELIYDKKFQIHNVITADRMYGQQFKVVAEPSQEGRGWRHRLVLISLHPLTESVNLTWIQEGKEYQFLYSAIGEFTQEFPGLGELGETIELYDTIGGGTAKTHAVTDWADTRSLRGAQLELDKPENGGGALDIITYSKKVRNETGLQTKLVAWEPFIEAMMKKELLEEKAHKIIWSHGGTSYEGQELIKHSLGVYPRMRLYGNVDQYNVGEFSVNIIRNMFGDLFYRRVDMASRKVKMFTNEAGMEVFRTAAKDDLLKAGLTIIADDRFIHGTAQHMQISWAFDSMYTSDTGEITLSHLMELDLPQTNSEFGRNKKSTPLFMVFDVSPMKDGSSLYDNVREVRHEGQPSMTWGYIDGTRHHLGFAASQGMTSSSTFPGYKIWMKDRYDVFMEDPTRTALIEQVPQF